MLKSNRTVDHSIFSNSTVATKQFSLLFVYLSIHRTLLYMGIHQLLFQISIQFFRGFTLPQKQPLDCSIKNVLVKILLNLLEKTCVEISCSIKLQVWSLKKRDFDKSVFLWILWNISEHLFWKTSASLSLFFTQQSHT